MDLELRPFSTIDLADEFFDSLEKAHGDGKAEWVMVRKIV